MGSCGHTDILLETVRFQLPGLGACQMAPIVTCPAIASNHLQDKENIKAKVEFKNGGRVFFFLILAYFTFCRCLMCCGKESRISQRFALKLNTRI